MFALGVVGGAALFLFGVAIGSWFMIVVGLLIAVGSWAGHWNQ